MNLKIVSLFIGHIVAERERQEALKLAGRFPYTCADPEISHSECFLVLAEELGEVANEVNEMIGGRKPINLEKLREELVQVAAVCLAWGEKIDSELGRGVERMEPDWPVTTPEEEKLIKGLIGK